MALAIFDLDHTLLSGDSDPVAIGTADGNTVNKLVDASAKFNTAGSKIQLRDIAVNTTDNGDFAAFVSAVDSDTTLSLKDISNSNSDKFYTADNQYLTIEGEYKNIPK